MALKHLKRNSVRNFEEETGLHAIYWYRNISVIRQCNILRKEKKIKVWCLFRNLQYSLFITGRKTETE